MAWDVARHGAVAVATFTRPPRNFMSFAAMGELGHVLDELAGRDDVSVVALTGGVPGYFVAHADLDDLGRLAQGKPTDGDPRSWGRTLALIESMPQPVVAAINGQAWGGGCELALACTMRVAAKSAHLAQPEVNVGIIPGAGGTQRLPRLVGSGRAAELILSGRVIDASEAARIGLVEAVLPDKHFVDEVLEWLAPVAAKPRRALVAAKRAIVDGLKAPSFDEALAIEGRLFIECQLGADAARLQAAALQRYASAPSGQTVEL
jgi:enoyl-CoA hydratase